MSFDLIEDSAFENGWQPSPNDPPRVRRVGSHVEVGGTVLPFVGMPEPAPLDPVFVLPEGFQPEKPHVRIVCEHGDGMVRGKKYTIDSHVRVPELLGERPSRPGDEPEACDGMCWSR